MLIGTTFTEYTVKLRTAPLAEVYNTPRVGKVALVVYDREGEHEQVASSSEEQTWTLNAEHEFSFESDKTFDEIDGVAIKWTPSSGDQKLFPVGFNVVNEQGQRLRLCRRKASDGIAAGAQYIFRRFPVCFHDRDQ